MIAQVAYAEGSPCPTLVLPSSLLPTAETELAPVLAAVHEVLRVNGMGHVLKIALIAQSDDAYFDLTYRFIQCVPGPQPHFEFGGSCGHSILSAVLVASRLGWVPLLHAGQQVRVDVRNNGDTVVCGVDAAGADRAHFTVRFHRHPQPRLSDLLLFGEPVTDLDYPGGRVRISGVSIGNPYVFVDAADLGRPSAAKLFAEDQELFTTLGAIRKAAEQRLGWPPGTFPKVAALLSDSDNTVAARAISVPSWHPTLALTGVACLAVASMIPGTVPASLRPKEASRLMIRTAQGRTSAKAKVTGRAPDQQRLDWVSVSGKVVRFVSAMDIRVFARCPTDRRVSALTTDRATGA